MYPPCPPLTEDLDILAARLRRKREPQRTSRLPLLGLLQSGQVTSRGHAATPLALPRHTVAAWLRRSRDGGLAAWWPDKKADAPGGQKPLPPAGFEPRQPRLATPTGLASSLAGQP
jgi:hypothetical protein